MISLLFIILVLGVIAWVISQMPMPNPFKAAAYGVLIIILLILLANLFGVDTGLNIR